MTEQRRERIRAVISRRQSDLTVVIEDIHDPHNVSAILRSADAVGILEVQLVYTKEKFPRLGKKSSASATKWVTRRPFRSAADCYDQLHKEGFTICATHLGRDSVSLYDLDLTKKIALVFGNEHRGVSDEAARLADMNFQIPMSGMIQSLNVSVASAVSLYEVYRQRHRSPESPFRGLDEETKERLLKEWIEKR